MIEVELSVEKLGQSEWLGIVEKPWFVDVEVVEGANAILNSLDRINDTRTRGEIFEERWRGINVTEYAVFIYIINRGNETLTIADRMNHMIFIRDIYGKDIGGCGLRVHLINAEPVKIPVELGQRKQFIYYIIEYKENRLYIRGNVCGPELGPGKYIIKTSHDTNSPITVTLLLSIKPGS